MAAANPLWRAPRIHGKLKMLGIDISERTVSRILRGLRRPPNQNWKTFLHNHVGKIVFADSVALPGVDASNGVRPPWRSNVAISAGKSSVSTIKESSSTISTSRGQLPTASTALL
jgi:hypothetical protein